MSDQSHDPLPTFFVFEVTYKTGGLVLRLADGADHPLMEVTFAHARAFRCYAESDYWHYLNEFRGKKLIVTTDRGCGIELSHDAPYVLDYRTHVRLQEPEDVFACLIRTPDQCVEVICFEPPKLRYL